MTKSELQEQLAMALRTIDSLWKSYQAAANKAEELRQQLEKQGGE